MQLEGGREAGGRDNPSAAIPVQQKNSAGISVHAIIILCARRNNNSAAIDTRVGQQLCRSISTRSAAISVQGNAQVSWAHRGHGIPKHWPDHRIGVIVLLSNILALSLLA